MISSLPKSKLRRGKLRSSGWKLAEAFIARETTDFYVYYVSWIPRPDTAYPLHSNHDLTRDALLEAMVKTLGSEAIYG